MKVKGRVLFGMEKFIVDDYYAVRVSAGAIIKKQWQIIVGGGVLNNDSRPYHPFEGMIRFSIPNKNR